MTQLVAACASHKGNLREINQDAVLADDHIFAVADGMGGHSGGEVASAIAVEEMAKLPAESELAELISHTQAANTAIFARARSDHTLSGMGTTIVALALLANPTGHTAKTCLGAVNVGDSRIYLHTPNSLFQLSKDHSYVGELVSRGLLSAAEAKVHPQRSMLSRAVGIEHYMLADAWELELVGGDRYLLCSDGLTNELRDEEICAILDARQEPAEAASALVEAACAARGRDNVSVVVVDVSDDDDDDDDGEADDVDETDTDPKETATKPSLDRRIIAQYEDVAASLPFQPSA